MRIVRNPSHKHSKPAIMRKKIIIPVLSLSLCGCAAIKSGGVYQEDTRQSLAMNVASAAGIAGKPKEGLP